MNSASPAHVMTAMQADETTPVVAAPGFSKDINNYLNSYVGVADDKARAVVTLDTIALGVVMAWSNINPTPDTAHIVTIALFVIGAALSAWVLFPRTPKGGTGVIFWEDIRAHPTADDYRQHVQRLTPLLVEQNFALQNYQVSHVLHTKHIFLRWAMLITALGVLSAVVDYWWL